MLRNEDFDRLNPYWRPVEGEEYPLVQFSQWEIKDKNFGPELVMQVVSVNNMFMRSPKEFSTKSYSLIEQLRPIILAAQQRGNDSIFVALLRSNKKYQVHDRSLEIEQYAKNVMREQTEKKTPVMSYGGVHGAE